MNQLELLGTEAPPFRVGDTVVGPRGRQRGQIRYLETWGDFCWRAFRHRQSKLADRRVAHVLWVDGRVSCHFVANLRRARP